MKYVALRIYCDGGARGNPGPAAVGVVIENLENGNAVPLASFGKKIGEATNNVAEYQSVIAAFTYLRDAQIFSQKIVVFMDSQVVSRQLTGLYKIRKPHLQELYTRVKTLEPQVGEFIEYSSVLRSSNVHADALVNEALDGKAD